MYATPRRSTLISGLLHAGAIALILAVTRVQPSTRPPHIVLIYEPRGLPDYAVAARPDAGGGGGVRSESPASRGGLPPAARRQFTPPVVRIENFDPALPMAPTIVADADLVPPLNSAIFGDPFGAKGLPSGGVGTGGGIGDGDGTGVGPGHGPGAGPGRDGGIGGTTSYRMEGGRVTEPVLLWKIEPDYTEEARKARLQGVVVLRIEVDAQGRPQNIALGQGLGLGLDERAIEAVRRWRFKPGFANGRPVGTRALVQVYFRLL